MTSQPATELACYSLGSDSLGSVHHDPIHLSWLKGFGKRSGEGEGREDPTHGVETGGKKNPPPFLTVVAGSGLDRGRPLNGSMRGSLPHPALSSPLRADFGLTIGVPTSQVEASWMEFPGGISVHSPMQSCVEELAEAHGAQLNLGIGLIPLSGLVSPSQAADLGLLNLPIRPAVPSDFQPIATGDSGLNLATKREIDSQSFAAEPNLAKIDFLAIDSEKSGHDSQLELNFGTVLSERDCRFPALGPEMSPGVAFWETAPASNIPEPAFPSYAIQPYCYFPPLLLVPVASVTNGTLKWAPSSPPLWW